MVDLTAQSMHMSLERVLEFLKLQTVMHDEDNSFFNLLLISFLRNYNSRWLNYSISSLGHS